MSSKTAKIEGFLAKHALVDTTVTNSSYTTAFVGVIGFILALAVAMFALISFKAKGGYGENDLNEYLLIKA